MGDNLNRVILQGNLVRTPELKSTTKGTALLELSIACGEWRKEGDDYTNFFDCKLWGKRAESIHQFLRQGLQVTIEGRLHQDRWEKDGQKRSKIVVNVDNLYLPQRQKDDGIRPMSTPSSSNVKNDFEDSIPF